MVPGEPEGPAEVGVGPAGPGLEEPGEPVGPAGAGAGESVRSRIRPSRTSMRRSAATRAPSRWETVTTVRPAAARGIAATMAASLARSTWLVGSSRSSRGRSARIARARDRRWACPPDSPRPCSPSTVSRPWGMRRTSASRPTVPRAAHICSLVASGAARRRLWAIVLVKSQVVWATRALAARTWSWVRALEAVPATRTVPPLGRRSPDSRAMRVDLPDPEGPMTARCCPVGTLRSTPWSTSGPSGPQEARTLSRRTAAPGSAGALGASGAPRGLSVARI